MTNPYRPLTLIADPTHAGRFRRASRRRTRLPLRIGPVRTRLCGAGLRMLAYNGSVPGQVLHVDQGSQITVQVRNDGDVEATVHWHGLRLENRYDGVPHETQEPIPIGGTFT